MKKPASKIIGGNMQNKNTVDERGESTSKFVTKIIMLMTMPTKISQQESGINCSACGKLLRTVNNIYETFIRYKKFDKKNIIGPNLTRLALKTQIATTKGIETLGKLGTTIGILLRDGISVGLATDEDSSCSAALGCLPVS